MLSVSPPAPPSGMAFIEEARSTKRRRFEDTHDPYYVAPHDVDLNGAFTWSDGQSDQEQGCEKGLSSSSSLQSDGDVGDQERASPSSSISPMSSVEPVPTAQCLLIRSMHQGWERTFELHHDWPIPRIQRPDEVLISHRAVGLNPVDFKSVLYKFGIPDAPWILGRDVAGVVAAVGPDVTDFKPGQRVWTCADARDVRAGAYQSYSVCRRAHLGRASERLSDAEAATLGTGLVTAAIAAYWFFRWPRAQVLAGQPDEKMPRHADQAGEAGRPTWSGPDPASRKRPWLLIYGGGAVTGIFMAQLARLSGLRTVAVASPPNFEYLQSEAVGVTACVDRYATPEEIAQQVREITQKDGSGGVRYILDCVGSTTATLCRDVAVSTLEKEKGKDNAGAAEMVCLAGNPKPSVRSEDKALQDPITVHRISFSTTIYGDELFARSVMDDLGELLDTDQLQPVRPEFVSDGLAGVRRGLERLRDNKAPRAKKLVVHIPDTPHAHHTNLGVRAETCWNGVA